MAFKLKSGNKTNFKNMGSSPAKHFVDDVPEHNDGHSDDLQTPEEHEAGKVESPAKQVKSEGFGPWNQGGVKNPELTKTKKPFSKKVMKDGSKNRVHNAGDTGDWQPHQFKAKKSTTTTHGQLNDAQAEYEADKKLLAKKKKPSPNKQTDTTYADGSKKSKREQAFSKRHTAEKAKDKYWYKIDGKKATKAQYLKYENKPGNMESGGKQTNNPDVYGKIASNHGRGPKTKK